MGDLGFMKYEDGIAKSTTHGEIGIHSSETGTLMKKITRQEFLKILKAEVKRKSCC